VTTGLRFLLPLAGIGLVTAVGQGIGFVLLIVPGVILSLAWSVAAPAEVVEQTGVFGSIGRSVDLTRNHRGAIFALWVVYLAVQFAVQTAIRFALGIGIGATNLLTHDGIFGSFLITSTVYSLVERTLFGAVSAAGIASVYYELREIKDGVGAQQLAAVFD
jgi:hypothetical protein